MVVPNWDSGNLNSCVPNPGRVMEDLRMLVSDDPLARTGLADRDGIALSGQAGRRPVRRREESFLPRNVDGEHLAAAVLTMAQGLLALDESFAPILLHRTRPLLPKSRAPDIPRTQCSSSSPRASPTSELPKSLGIIDH